MFVACKDAVSNIARLRAFFTFIYFLVEIAIAIGGVTRKQTNTVTFGQLAGSRSSRSRGFFAFMYSLD